MYYCFIINAILYCNCIHFFFFFQKCSLQVLEPISKCNWVRIIPQPSFWVHNLPNVIFQYAVLLLDMGNPLKSPLFRGIAKKLSPLLGLQKCKTSAFVTYLGNCISVLPTLNFYFANFFNFFPIFQKILIFFRKS